MEDTDTKIVAMVEAALKNGWSDALFKLAVIIEKRAQFHKILDELETQIPPPTTEEV